MFSIISFLMSAALIMAPVISGPPYYHEEGNVNYPGSYFESVYVDKSVGIDDYITIVDLALMARAFGTGSEDPWGVGWNLYNPDAEITGDGIVNMRDVGQAARNWGLNYHYSQFETVDDKTKVKVKAPEHVEVGEQFIVKIAIKDVENLNAYEFTLSWKPDLMEMISVVGGGFISPEDFPLKPIAGAGYTYVGDLPDVVSDVQNGSGTLAKITFECLEKGKTTLDLSSRLLDYNLTPMPHKDIDAIIRQRP